MSKSPTIHYNPINTKNKTACGSSLKGKEWRTDPADVTCNRCLLSWVVRDIHPGILNVRGVK